MQSKSFAPSRPSLAKRTASSIIMGATGMFSSFYLQRLNSVEVIGLQKFMDILDRRKTVAERKRGLLTVSNHISVVDDPFIWGVLPIRYAFDPANHRWSLGAHDICFRNKLFATFFTAGQVLPTHRYLHSPYGGLFQPTMSQALRLLSSHPFVPRYLPSAQRTLSTPLNPLTFSTLPESSDAYPSPSSYLSRAHSWLHVFPEGQINQDASLAMRYFKWGVSRLILEAEPAPEIVPIFVAGTHEIMSEQRTWPRFLPRVGKKVTVVFGDSVDTEAIFGDLRDRWRKMCEKYVGTVEGRDMLVIGGHLPEELRTGTEATRLRIETAMRVRNEILKLRKSQGYPDEDPSFAQAATWAKKAQNDDIIDGS